MMPSTPSVSRWRRVWAMMSASSLIIATAHSCMSVSGADTEGADVVHPGGVVAAAPVGEANVGVLKQRHAEVAFGFGAGRPLPPGERPRVEARVGREVDAV